MRRRRRVSPHLAPSHAMNPLTPIDVGRVGVPRIHAANSSKNGLVRGHSLIATQEPFSWKSQLSIRFDEAHTACIFPPRWIMQETFNRL